MSAHTTQALASIAEVPRDRTFEPPRELVVRDVSLVGRDLQQQLAFHWRRSDPFALRGFRAQPGLTTPAEQVGRIANVTSTAWTTSFPPESPHPIKSFGATGVYHVDCRNRPAGGRNYLHHRSIGSIAFPGNRFSQPHEWRHGRRWRQHVGGLKDSSSAGVAVGDAGGDGRKAAHTHCVRQSTLTRRAALLPSRFARWSSAVRTVPDLLWQV